MCNVIKEFGSGQCLLQTDEAILDAVRVDAERGELVETVIRTASRPSEHTHLLERWQCEYVLILCTMQLDEFTIYYERCMIGTKGPE